MTPNETIQDCIERIRLAENYQADMLAILRNEVYTNSNATYCIDEIEQSKRTTKRLVAKIQNTNYRRNFKE